MFPARPFRHSLGAALVCVAVALALPAQAAPGPDIDVWHGTSRTVGALGVPQTWLNVLGNVSDPDGVSGLRYSLNGGAWQDLTIGPDTARLKDPGDFNVEIAYRSLRPGPNQLTLEADDTLSNTSQVVVNLDFVGEAGPVPYYSIDWSTVADIHDVATIGDGLWSLSAAGIRTAEPWYDQTVVVGDVAWSSYEVVADVLIHGETAPGPGFGDGSSCGNFGFGLRWPGHVDWGATEQPRTGWLPVGAAATYTYCGSPRLALGSHDDGWQEYAPTSFTLADGVPYTWRMRVEQGVDQTLYSFKVWESAQPEPAAWTLTGSEGPTDVQNGSLLLVAHHVDVTFGNLQITPLGAETAAPVVSGVTVDPGETSAHVSFATDEPASARIDFGETSAYELGSVYRHGPATAHALVLPGLVTGTTYRYRLTVVDEYGNAAQTAEASFVAGGAYESGGFVDDEFDSDPAAGSTWTLVDPIGDVSFSHAGSQFSIALPGGTDHRGPDAARAMQPADDTDFQAEVHFANPVDQVLESHGIRVEGTDGLGLVFEIISTDLGSQGWAVHAGNETENLFEHTTSFSTRYYQAQSVAQENRLRVTRAGDHWELATSSDGASWTVHSEFYLPMDVAAIGVHATNQGFGGPTPAHTAVVESFRNTSSSAGGTSFTLTTNTSGNGSVTRDPDQTLYPSGQVVELTAVPDPGWSFSGWSGDLTSTDNPLFVAMASDVVLTATFLDQSDTTPPVISNLSVAPSASGATITWDTDEPATGIVDYGLDAGYGSSASSPLATSHSVQLSGLAPATTYHFDVTATDALGNAASSGDQTFATQAGPGPFESDDFSAPSLDTQRWVTVDPAGDATFSVTGTQLSIAIPTTPVVHDVWEQGNLVPRAMQDVVDSDFELEAKFESGLTSPDFQSQGILIEQSPTDVIRIEFYTFAGQTAVFVASVLNGTGVSRGLIETPLTAPMWLRVNRTGDRWLVDWSLDGVAWSNAADFDLPFGVTRAGVYAGSGSGIAHSALVDYAFETASPIVPEDGETGIVLTTSVVGNGSVTRNPDKPGYDAGEIVELTAVPDAGWVFDRWSGDLSGAVNPTSVNVSLVTDVTAEFVSAGGDVTPPVISGISVVPSATSATISWTTDEDATGVVDYGLDAGYGSQQASPSGTAHSVVLTGLTPGTTWHYAITATDLAGNPASTADATFATTDPPGAFESDDFSAPALDPRWSFSNPFGDATAAVNGSQLEIAIPATPNVHDVWTQSNDLPRVMQDVADADFEVEAKFESALGGPDFKSQGILVEQSTSDVIRTEFHTLAGTTRIYAATIVGGQATTRVFSAIPVAAPMHLRLGRVGDVWTLSWSGDGSAWTVATTFSQALTVSRVGVYAGSGASVAHTALVDYAFDTANPIVPEDGGAGIVLDLSTTGSGAITRDPDQPSYAAGTNVTLTAVPDPGWVFDTWSGDLASTSNPLVIDPGVTQTLVGNFVPDPADVTPPVISNLQVSVTNSSATLTWNTDEGATGSVDYGLDTGYGSSAVTPYGTAHGVTLNGLLPDTDYHFEVGALDAAGNLATTGDAVFHTDPGPAPLVSDDFSAPVLDASLWSVVDPVGDATVSVTGTQLRIDLPASPVIHDVWTGSNTLPRVVQDVADGDFEVEFKFESPLPAAAFRSQGVLIEQSASDVIRTEFHTLGGQTNVFVATLIGGSAQVRAFTPVSLGAASWLRITRGGDAWSVDWSTDGSAWTNAASFTQAMTVTRIGPFAGSSADTAHSVLVDYAFETGSPIVPEDGNAGVVLDVTTTGNGSVSRDPDQVSYPAGTSVTLTAVPDAGWSFDQWSGELSGAVNPTTINVSLVQTIVAEFVPDGSDTTPPTISNVVITPVESGAVVTWDVDEPATGEVAWGLDTGYGSSQPSPAGLATSHSITLAGLEGETEYHLQISATDAAGNLAQSADLTFTTPPGPSSFQSDDFAVAPLDTALWSFVNPFADASATVVGQRLEIDIPATAQIHDVWVNSNDLPRVMQDVLDADFSIEAKFESLSSGAGFRSQGILIEQNEADVLRIEYHFQDGQARVFVASIVSQSAVVRAFQSVPLPAGPTWLRVLRSGDQWTVEYSSDGSGWSTAASFSQPLAVTRAGVYAGSGASTAWTAQVDYVFNLAAPIVPEDGTP